MMNNWITPSIIIASYIVQSNSSYLALASLVSFMCMCVLFFFLHSQYVYTFSHRTRIRLSLGFSFFSSLHIFHSYRYWGFSRSSSFNRNEIWNTFGLDILFLHSIYNVAHYSLSVHVFFQYKWNIFLFGIDKYQFPKLMPVKTTGWRACNKAIYLQSLLHYYWSLSDKQHY